MNFIAGLFPATVASLSFVNYGGKFRLEWMSTSERAECFCPVWQLSQTRYVGEWTPVKPMPLTHETHKPPGLMVIPGTKQSPPSAEGLNRAPYIQLDSDQHLGFFWPNDSTIELQMFLGNWVVLPRPRSGAWPMVYVLTIRQNITKLVSPDGVSPSLSLGDSGTYCWRLLSDCQGSCSSRQPQSTTPTRSPASPGRELQASLPGFCDTNSAPFPARFSLCSLLVWTMRHEIGGHVR